MGKNREKKNYTKTEIIDIVEAFVGAEDAELVREALFGCEVIDLASKYKLSDARVVTCLLNLTTTFIHMQEFECRMDEDEDEEADYE